MGLGVADAFIEAVRLAVGLPAKPRTPPEIIFLGLYEATVRKCADDGSTCDVEPTVAGVPGAKDVEVRSGIPGAAATVQPGALVLLGWKGGDRKQPYCMPAWGSGATVTKLVIKAAAVYIGDEGGADALVTKTDFDSHTHLPGALTAPTGGGAVTGDSGAPVNPATGTQKLKAV